MAKKHVITAEPFQQPGRGGPKTRYYVRIHVALGWPVDARIPKRLYDELMDSQSTASKSEPKRKAAGEEK